MTSNAQRYPPDAAAFGHPWPACGKMRAPRHPRMNFARALHRPWLLMLLLACSLLGRPLHENWHIAHWASEIASAAAQAGDAAPGEERDDAGDDSLKRGDTCAWCLFHLQASLPGAVQLPGAAPATVIARAEPPRCGLPVGRCASAAHARGPPRG